MLPLVRVALAGVVALAVVGCGGGGDHAVSTSPPRPTGEVAHECAALVSAAPSKVADQPERDTTPSSPYVAAWGDPAIVLRCGGPAPAALRPTSQCFVIDGVGWLVTQGGVEVDAARSLTGDLDFTTIGRSAYVSVQVPGAYQPAADAILDLIATVKEHTTDPRPCQ